MDRGVVHERQHPGLAELMDRVDHQLCTKDRHEPGRHAKQASQIDAVAVAHPQQADSPGQQHTDRTTPGHQPGLGVDRQRSDHRGSLHALTADHENGEQKNRPPGPLSTQCRNPGQPVANVLTHALPGMQHVHHAPDHGSGSQQCHDPGPGRREFAHLRHQDPQHGAEHQGSEYPPAHGTEQLQVLRLAQVHAGDGDHQKGLEAFTKTDQQSLEHGDGTGGSRFTNDNRSHLKSQIPCNSTPMSQHLHPMPFRPAVHVKPHATPCACERADRAAVRWHPAPAGSGANGPVPAPADCPGGNHGDPTRPRASH